MTNATAPNDTLDEKIARHFGEVAFRKGLGGDVGLRDGRNIPTYVEEWLVGRYAPGATVTDEARAKIFSFVRDHLPGKGEKEGLKNRLLMGETLTILDAYRASVDLKSGERRVHVRCIDVEDALVDEDVLAEHPALFAGSVWGAGKLVAEYVKTKNRVRLIDFKPMQSGRVDLATYKGVRRHFTFEEWRAVLLRSMGYDPGSYSPEQQSVMLMRLIPLVQPRINIMELAPKGTGKSFVYTNLSRYCWVVSGGTVTAATLFYNNATRTPGLFTQYDVVVLDEGQSIQFANPREMAGLLKGYLESGEYTRGNNRAAADAGIVILANIPTIDDMPAQTDYIRALPDVFQESAVLDRFHGIIPGWILPRFTAEAAAHGMGLKADYLAEALRGLRGEIEHMDFVRSHSEASGDKRDITAIERQAAALLKLYFPDLRASADEFQEHCLGPALDLRRRVRSQLERVDPGSFAGRSMATVRLKDGAF